MMTPRHALCALAAAAAISLAAPARADIVFTIGNVPQTDENVLLNSGETGNTVFGETNQTSTVVRFDSTQTITLPANGQARVEADMGDLTNVAISVPGFSFTSIIFNPRSGDGDLDVTVSASDGVFGFSYPLGNGQNFLTITAINGETIFSVALSADDGFADLRQVRIGGLAAIVDVPVPMSLALFGMGLAGLGLAVRRRA
ncbi:hypothetical protein ACI6QG_08255 [Roseococcus sp. DSY-14]|uniref:hypothetical protein n=1 Tax=Roseococcus sp. DSY-14 TaxID=3369650 RepID=UPI00387AFAEF